MTLKELKTEFTDIVKFGGKYQIYVEGGRRSPYKYLASVNKRGESFWVDGFKPTTKMEILKGQIDEFVKSLPYDSEYYNPRFRAGVTEEHIMIDHLDSLGFKHDGSHWNSSYFEYNKKSIYGHQLTDVSLSISGLDAFNELKEMVNIILHLEPGSWVSSKCKRTVEDMIKTIDGLLKPLLVTEAVSHIQTSDKMKTSDVDIILNQLKDLDAQSTDIKDNVKTRLLEIANSLQ
jgi:hypothetical protein